MNSGWFTTLDRHAGRLAAGGFAGLLAATWASLALAELGVFNRWFPPIAAAVAGTAVAARWPSKAATRPVDATWPLALLVALCSLLLTLPASEMILGGWDPGVYLHTAASVAASGSLQFDHPDLAGMQGEWKELLVRNLHGIDEPFGGMRVLPNGRISPQFYHAYPCLLALAWSWGGLWLALAVNPLLNVACILAGYVLLRRWVGSRWALLGAIFLAMNPAQIWQAKFSTAEVLTQLCLMGGMACYARLDDIDSKHGLCALLGGAGLGLAWLTRYDTLIFLVPFSFLFLLGLPFSSRRPARVLFAILLALCAAQVWAHQRFVAPFYHPLSNLVKPGLMALLWLAICTSVLYLEPVRRRVTRTWEKVRTACFALAAAGFTLWAVFAWLVRPSLASGGPVSRLFRTVLTHARMESYWTVLSGPEAGNMHYLQSILGGTGLCLALAGIAVALFRARAHWQVSWLWPSVGVMVMLVNNVYHDHFMMWVARRYLPVSVPLLICGLVYAISALARRLRMLSPRVGTAAACGLAGISLIAPLPGIAAVTTVRDWPGLVDWYANAQRHVPEDAWVFCDQPGFAAPLRFLYARSSFELHVAGNPERRRRLSLLMREAARQGHPVLFLTSTPLASGELDFAPVAYLPLTSSVLQHTRYALPLTTRSRGGAFMLYAVPGDR